MRFRNIRPVNYVRAVRAILEYEGKSLPLGDGSGTIIGVDKHLDMIDACFQEMVEDRNRVIQQLAVQLKGATDDAAGLRVRVDDLEQEVTDITEERDQLQRDLASTVTEQDRERFESNDDKETSWPS